MYGEQVDEQRRQFVFLVRRLDKLAAVRVTLFLAHLVGESRLPPDIRETVELARALWARRN